MRHCYMQEEILACEERSDEAIQFLLPTLDCFASLAMTKNGPPHLPSVGYRLRSALAVLDVKNANDGGIRYAPSPTRGEEKRDRGPLCANC
jgi:hypothetical protein